MYLPGIETNNYCVRLADYSIQTRWQDEPANNVTTLEELKEYINLTDLEEKELQEVIDLHLMSITRYYLSLIDSKDPDDPIRKMALPSAEELNVSGE